MALRKFIIERDIPKVGTFQRDQLRAAAAKSNQVLHQLGPDIQWVELCRRRQDLLRLSRPGRSHHSQARRDQRISPRPRSPKCAR
jgi:hypothetical protein